MLQTSLQALLDALPDQAAILDSAGVVVAVNAAWRRSGLENGGCAHAAPGTNYLDVCEAAAEFGADAQAIARGLRGVLAGAREFRCEYPCDAPDRGRWFELIATPLPPGALVLRRDVTAPRGDIEALNQRSAFADDFAALVASSSDAILSFDLEGRILTWNAAAERLYGYAQAEAIGASVERLYPPSEPLRIGDYIRDIVAGRLRTFEVVRRARSGDLIDVAVSAAPILGADGAVVAVSNIHRDISGAKRRFERQEFVARELAHRFKNMLTIVSSIASQTARRASTVAAFRETFVQRIGGLARSNDLLLGSDLGGATLRALVEGHLEPFVATDDARVSIVGDNVALGPEAVHALGMAFHELATNAVKYGALHAADGRLSIQWKLHWDGGQHRLAIVWSERAACIASAQGKGFGNVVLTALTQRALGAEVVYAIDPGRLDWRLDLPSAHFDLVEAAKG